jgi:hypothetical protein
MSARNVQFHLTLAVDDPQGPARVMGVFAARSILPSRFLCLHQPNKLQIEIQMEIGEGDPLIPEHIARLLKRIATVESVALRVDGILVAFEQDGAL